MGVKYYCDLCKKELKIPKGETKPRSFKIRVYKNWRVGDDAYPRFATLSDVVCVSCIIKVLREHNLIPEELGIDPNQVEVE